MVSIEEKNKLLERIKNETKFYDIRLEGTGCESVMGFITPEAYEYWHKKSDREFGSYLAEYRDYNLLNKVPTKAQLTKEWYEYDDIAHVTGVIANNQNKLYIDRYDKKFGYEKTVLALPLDKTILEQAGVRMVCSATTHYDPTIQLVGKHYFYGESKEKGVWYTEDKIKSKLHNFNLKDLWLRFSVINDVPVIHEVEYDGLDYYLTADTKGTKFNVGVKKGMSKADFGEINNTNPWIVS